MKPIKNSIGFTLVELIVVVTIFSIIAAIATPSFRELIYNQRVKSASFELYASLMLARSEAIKRNDNVTISAVSGSWQNGWQLTASDGTVLKDHPSLTKIIVSNAPATIIFKKTGRISGASPSLEVNTDPATTNFIRCISIELSGLPRTKKGSCS